MYCLRCAGAPRRPASGSALYLPDLSQHVVLYVPGEPLAAYIQFLRDAHWPSPGTDRLGTPDVKRCRGLLDRHCYNLLSCSPPSQETFTSELSTVWSPSPLSDMTTVATGQFPPAGLTPARSAASVAAPVPGFRCQFLSDMPSPSVLSLKYRLISTPQVIRGGGSLGWRGRLRYCMRRLRS